MTSLETDFEMHAKWQISIEEPAAKDFVARKVHTIELNEVQETNWNTNKFKERLGSVIGHGIVAGNLGWEFKFLVPISGTPIGSGIPIPFLIPKILVGKLFSKSAVEKSRNWNSDSKIRNSKKNKRRISIHFILHVMSIVIGQPVGLTMYNHMDVGTIPSKGNLSA
jgi:hypothetical protein